MSRKKSIIASIFALLAAVSLLSAGLAPVVTRASSHREAPLIAKDPTADITDFFMFRSYEAGHEGDVVLIMNVIPFEEPSGGPNFYNFDPNVLYSFHIDNNKNGVANDVVINFQFTNEFRGVNKDLGLFLGFVALPQITALDGAGSEGLGLRQKYTMTIWKNGKKVQEAEDMIAVPSNVGPRTMPDYASLAEQGIYSLDNGVRVFAGQRADPFYIDLGGVFDTLNLRRSPLPLLTAAEDANDQANAFGVNALAGYNVNTIAVELPASMLTSDGKSIQDTSNPVIGAYLSTSRHRVTVLDTGDNGDQMAALSDMNRRGGNPFVQIERLANPLVNESIIGTDDKDRWNMQDPSNESQFLDYYQNPRLAVALETVFNVPAEKTGRTDLSNLLLKYNASDNDKKDSELLRLDLSVPPTPFDSQKRLGPLAHDASGTSTPDPSGWPNGRRPVDDVTDIAVRVVGGPNYIQGMAGDGINYSDAPLLDAFPFLATPYDGLNRVHQNPQ